METKIKEIQLILHAIKEENKDSERINQQADRVNSLLGEISKFQPEKHKQQINYNKGTKWPD